MGKMCLVIFLCTFFLMFVHGTSTEFAVGEIKGWEVPPLNHSQLYNVWAQKNRFKVNDTLLFKYKKDSVMVVTEEEYDKCRSTRPFFFSNNGNTCFLLDRPGLFYFISGVTGHCERGQKMIVKVLDVENPSNQQPGDGSSDDKKKNGATQTGVTSFLSLIMILMVVGFHFVA